MTIRWNKEDTMFDSLYEADVWSDSIRNEIYAKLYDGYDTPDYKIAFALAFRLTSMKEFRVISEITNEKRYLIWVVRSDF